ncbi:hypothetical protein K0B96_06495 [Horticoccus luteus]|uniref:Uncharacterized protein n=1 Tax=Horticoccus luteus TaxID=2862869 RepID=A0A8F9XL20_9BACT|nr:hypothetical protein [Horticoccus luteus]QYM80258.1 hypothetical protein K0B96_06495 [Horticoccus luteus]
MSTENPCVADLFATLQNTGAASLAVVARDRNDVPLRACLAVDGREESAEVYAAFSAITDAWDETDTVGSSTLIWIDARVRLPEPLRDVLIACRGEHEASEGFCVRGAWQFATGHPAKDVHAWAELPRAPRPCGAKGGAA